MLHEYPCENGKDQATGIPDRLPFVLSAALRPAEANAPLQLRDEFADKLVGGERISPLAVEQYRRLAVTIHERRTQRGLKTLMVTSTLPNEGKTLTVVNLALTLAQSYRRRVLLIDADLRRPYIHEIFQVPNVRGLGDVLASERAEMPLVEVSEHLALLPAGHADQPLERLTSGAMRTLLERCEASFDWVLLDAAPVGLTPDARVLAALTRAVLFVIAARSTPHLLVTRAIAELNPQYLVGTVLNRMKVRDIPAREYYRDYYAPIRSARTAFCAWRRFSA